MASEEVTIITTCINRKQEISCVRQKKKRKTTADS